MVVCAMSLVTEMCCTTAIMFRSYLTTQTCKCVCLEVHNATWLSLHLLGVPHGGLPSVSQLWCVRSDMVLLPAPYPRQATPPHSDPVFPFFFAFYPIWGVVFHFWYSDYPKSCFSGKKKTPYFRLWFDICKQAWHAPSVVADIATVVSILL